MGIASVGWQAHFIACLEFLAGGWGRRKEGSGGGSENGRPLGRPLAHLDLLSVYPKRVARGPQQLSALSEVTPQEYATLALTDWKVPSGASLNTSAPQQLTVLSVPRAQE